MDIRYAFWLPLLSFVFKTKNKLIYSLSSKLPCYFLKDREESRVIFDLARSVGWFKRLTNGLRLLGSRKGINLHFLS